MVHKNLLCNSVVFCQNCIKNLNLQQKLKIGKDSFQNGTHRNSGTKDMAESLYTVHM
jgi:hypothetical protein